jgi:hypothetical protein
MRSREEVKAMVARRQEIVGTCQQRWRRSWETVARRKASGEMVRGDEFVQVKKYRGFSVKMPARSLFWDGGSTIFVVLVSVFKFQ